MTLLLPDEDARYVLDMTIRQREELIEKLIHTDRLCSQKIFKEVEDVKPAVKFESNLASVK